MERVTGIGGLFFRARDPKALKQWYKNNLGIGSLPGTPEDSGWEQQAGVTAFEPFPEKTAHFGNPAQMWMVNFRVGNLDAMAKQLQANGIEVTIDATAYPYGRFARLHDPEGNPIELWEPKD